MRIALLPAWLHLEGPLRRSWRRGALAACLVMAALPTGAQIYAGTNEHGTVVLSNFSGDQATDLVVDAPAVATVPPLVAQPDRLPNTFGRAPGWFDSPVASFMSGDMAARALALRPLIETAAREHDLSPGLLNAVIRVESGYQDRAVSVRGAVGLMQLMPQTARRFGVQNAFDPQQNIQGGARYLRWLLDYFGGDLSLALAGYNAGEAAVVRAGYRIPPFDETLHYVPRVLANLR
jgi:membrane-bound lytic murein transglycosylase B